jgi:hypothetical protein
MFSVFKKTLQNQNCFFWRSFYFSQLTKLCFEKVKISSKIIQFIKFDNFLADTI